MSRSFNGSSRYLSKSVDLVLAPFTVSAWFKTFSIGTTQVIFIVASGGDSGTYLLYRGGSVGAPLCATSNNSGVNSAEATTGVSNIVAGRWYHAAAVWASTTNRSVYLNGVKYSETTLCAPTGMTKTTIGAFNGSSVSTYWNGLLAEIGLWNVALSDDEILSLSKGSSANKIRPQSLVEKWDMVGNTTNENGIKGVTMTNTLTTHSDDHPRIYN